MWNLRSRALVVTPTLAEPMSIHPATYKVSLLTTMIILIVWTDEVVTIDPVQDDGDVTA